MFESRGRCGAIVLVLSLCLLLTAIGIRIGQFKQSVTTRDQPVVCKTIVESCDGIDNDCDGLVDEDDMCGPGTFTWYRDGDSDRYGSAARWRMTKTNVAPPGFVVVSGDCDDARSDTYPGAPDLSVDGHDQDCDGQDANR
ncbi:MAG: MopE-related protein [Patescibacteria group bacterium]